MLNSPVFENLPSTDGTIFIAPNTPYGQDIVYPKNRAEELAVAAKSNVIAIPEQTAETEYKTVPYTTITTEKTEVPYQETKVAEVAVPPAPAPVAMADERLPRTGSDVPLAALAGLTALGAAVAIRRVRS